MLLLIAEIGVLADWAAFALDQVTQTVRLFTLRMYPKTFHQEWKTISSAVSHQCCFIEIGNCFNFPFLHCQAATRKVHLKDRWLHFGVRLLQVVNLMSRFANLKHWMMGRLNFSISLCMALPPQILFGGLKHLLLVAVTTAIVSGWLGRCVKTRGSCDNFRHWRCNYSGGNLSLKFKRLAGSVEICGTRVARRHI